MSSFFRETPEDVARLNAKWREIKPVTRSTYFTTGPWFAVDETPLQSAQVFRTKGKGTLIADVFGVGMQGATANARLIAAAPDLLAALERAEAKLFALGREFCGPRFTDRYGDGPEMLAIAGDARLAIAKARGTV